MVVVDEVVVVEEEEGVEVVVRRVEGSLVVVERVPSKTSGDAIAPPERVENDNFRRCFGRDNMSPNSSLDGSRNPGLASVPTRLQKTVRMTQNNPIATDERAYFVCKHDLF